MEYPQTWAVNNGKNVEAIGKYGCLAMCYLYCVGIEPDTADYIQIVSNCMKIGVLDNECTVYNARNYLKHVTGKNFLVLKESCTDISTVWEPTPVRYDYNGHSHWVVVENGKIVFNPLEYSNCVTLGKPVTKRTIALEVA